MKSLTRLLSIVAVLCLAWTPNAVGQSHENVEGGNGFATEVLSETPLPDGNVLVRAMNRGFTWTNDADVAFGNGSMDCMGALIVGAEGKTLGGSGSCQAVDAEGDLWHVTYTDSGMGGGEWHIVGGTGKYAGMTGGGTWKNDVTYADGKQTNTWVGSWTMPETNDGM